MSDAVDARRHWMSKLACAQVPVLENAWAAIADKPTYRLVRGPEIGLAMLRGRAGGTGMRFNLGEMTMTRAVAQLADGTLGFGFIAGRAPRHAELAAVFDGMLQDPARYDGLAGTVIAALDEILHARRADAAAKAAATRVEFFTLVRGEDRA